MKKIRNFKKLEDVLNVPGYGVKTVKGLPTLVTKGRRAAFNNFIQRECDEIIADSRTADFPMWKMLWPEDFEMPSREEMAMRLTRDYSFIYKGWENVPCPAPTHLIRKAHKYGKTMSYRYYSVYDSRTGKCATLPVSNLIWMCCNPDKEIKDGFDIDHIDGNSLNDVPENLQCITRADNLAKRSGARNQYDFIGE